MKTRSVCITALWFTAGGLVTIGLQSAMRPAVADVPPAAAVKSTEELALAKKACTTLQDLQGRGRLDVKDMSALYDWSLRWAEADLTVSKNPKAYAEHLARMEDLAKYFGDRAAAGVTSLVVLPATQYYVAEAKRLAGVK